MTIDEMQNMFETSEKNPLSQLSKSNGSKVSNLEPAPSNGDPSRVRIQESNANLVDRMQFV